MECAMNEWSNAKLCDIANLILGLFLLLSPWIVGYSGSPEQNALISGVVITGVSLAALAALAQWGEWLNLLLGLWVVVADWVLGFRGADGAPVDVVVDLLVRARRGTVMLLLTQ